MSNYPAAPYNADPANQIPPDMGVSPAISAIGANPTGATYGSTTDVGLVREHNEDNLLVDPPLFAVCDGMGGHQAGEVASEIAVSVLDRSAPRKADADGLERSVEEANFSIIKAVGEGIGREGMGTTCTAAILDGERLIIAQVGDSRAYLLHNGILQQITRDHSLVADLVDNGEITPQEARVHPWRSYITRALGLDPRIHPDIFELNVDAGDRLMLCSDGLYAMVDDSQIEQILATTADPQMASNRLTQAAINAGGSDNVTVIVADATEFSAHKRKSLAKKTKITAGIIIGVLIALFILCGIALNYLTTTSAYLGEVDGRVAIYQGIPGDVAGISFSHLYEVSSVNIQDLQPGTARRITSNDIRCDSLQAAQKLVSEYAEDIEATKAGHTDIGHPAASNQQNLEPQNEANGSTGSTDTSANTQGAD